MDECIDSITLKNNIPVVPQSSLEMLSKSERQLSKFFKCCSKESFESNKKCFWNGNDVHKFKEHIQSSHEYVYCSYCVADKKSKEEINAFATENLDQLIAHMIEIHGRRLFQCNRCEYRASTSTHIHLHQMSIHYHIWSKYNSSIDYDSFSDQNSDICKIIVCKPITSGPDVNHSVLVKAFAPNLDQDLKENVFYCLYCDYCNEEELKVFMHCVHKHRDYDISIYDKECSEPFCFDDSEPEEVIEAGESDSDEPEDEPIIAKSLANSFDTQLSINSKPIPGIDDSFVSSQRPPHRPPHRPFRARNERFSSSFQKQNRFEKRGTKRKDSSDPYFEDDFEETFHSNEPIIENAIITPTTEQPFIMDRQPTPTIPPITTPYPQPPVICHLPQQNVKQQTLQQKKKKWQKFRKLESNEKLSEMTYGEYKKQQKQNKTNINTNLNSTPVSKAGAPPIDTQIPPEIDLQQTENELGIANESGIRNNSFKQIKRTGVSSDPNKSKAVTYIRRSEEENDEYLDLLNENKVPKRGVKARFENQTHFELTPLSITNNQFSSKNLYKCIICENGLQLRENNIAIHLRSVHKTDSSLKCGYCSYIGQRALIVNHSKVLHPNSELKVEKFIVHSTQNSSIGITSGSHLEKPRPNTTAKKSTGGVSQTAKGSKGALTQKIKESTYLGPLKNDVTQRKKTDPSQRKYSRSTHSSNIRPKKRQKLNKSYSESETEMQIENDIPSDLEPISDHEMRSDNESGVEQNESDNEVVEVHKKVSVAKKSTAKASLLNTSSEQVSITLSEEQIPVKYFCLFCSDVINDKSLAIEHYKKHLNLGYTCQWYCDKNECHAFFVSYGEMVSHWNEDHPTESATDMDFDDNMTDFIRQWIVNFLDDQIKCADFAENIVPNSSGINIECPLCVKAAKICNSVRPRSFDALWKVKLHICKHLNWFPMKCDLCEDSNTLFPQNPYLLMKHLVDCHFTSCENLYNISFRGQKPFNDMKREQLRLIDKNFTIVRLFSSDIINSFFYQLMTELDLIYEHQLKTKHHLNKEIQIKVDRLVQIKSEPIDVSDDSQEEEEAEPKSEVKDEDKKDIKLDIKTEFKTEIKSEMKTEFKSEVKTESKDEIKIDPENNEEIRASGEQFLSRLYGDDIIQMVPRPRASSKGAEEIVLSSDGES